MSEIINNSDKYKSNAHKLKDQEKLPEKRVEKVISGVAKKKKKSEIRKFTDIFIAEDLGVVKDYLLNDVLIPVTKKAISDLFTDGIAILLYGQRGKSGKSGNASKYSYSKCFDEGDRYDKKDSRIMNRRGIYSYDDVIIPSRGEAEEVLTRMEELIDRFDNVSVADLCEMVGITGSHTDYKFGWTDIRDIKSARVERVRDGYMLNLPRPRAL